MTIDELKKEAREIIKSKELISSDVDWKYSSICKLIDKATLAEKKRDAKIVPDTWLHPLLTGKDAVIGKPPWHEKDIRKLLEAIATAILNQQD